MKIKDGYEIEFGRNLLGRIIAGMDDDDAVRHYIWSRHPDHAISTNVIETGEGFRHPLSAQEYVQRELYEGLRMKLSAQDIVDCIPDYSKPVPEFDRFCVYPFRDSDTSHPTGRG